MKKTEAVKLMIECATLYQTNLESTNLLFVYSKSNASKASTFEATFLPRHFLHLTGAKFCDNRILTSVAFYQKCLDHRLAESDFEMSADGTTALKLSVLPQFMKRNLAVKMIGDYKDSSVLLRTDKVAGSVVACMGFVFEEGTCFYVPNTVLKKDTREVTKGDYARILAIYQKDIAAAEYDNRVYLAKGVDEGSLCIDRDAI